MTRSFSGQPVDLGVVRHILEAAVRAPTAGNTGGTAWVVLVGRDQTEVYWSATTDPAWRARNPERSEGLRRAPVVLLAYSSPAAYVARYAEADKAPTDLGRSPDTWPVPYWHGDAAFGVMTVLLLAVEAGLGACVLGAFRGEAELARALGVPAGWKLFSAVALGHRGDDEHKSRSLGRVRPEASERVHWGSWVSEGS